MMDVDTIATPVSDKSLASTPAASDLYRKIKDARTEARIAEKNYWQGEDLDRSMPHWKQVQSLGVNLLTNYRKDIDVASWLIESLLRTDGFDGLSHGFVLANRIINKFKDELYPQLDPDDGMDLKLQALAGLNGVEVDGSLIKPIYNVAISESPGYTLWQYQQSKTPERNQDHLGDLVNDLCLDDITNAISQTPSDFYRKLLVDINAALNNYAQLNQSLDIIFASNAPPCSRILDVLMTFSDQLKSLLLNHRLHLCVLDIDPVSNHKKATVNKSTSSHEVAMSSKSDVAPAEPVTPAVSQYTRDSALSELINIADYFAQREPQSVLPYMLKRVVDWAKLPAPELLSKMITNSGELAQVYALTGLNSNQPE